MLKLFIYLFLALFVTLAQAQMDPSTTLLMGSGSSPKESGLESGRYKVRSNSTKTPQESSQNVVNDTQMTIKLRQTAPAKNGKVSQSQKVEVKSTQTIVDKPVESVKSDKVEEFQKSTIPAKDDLYLAPNEEVQPGTDQNLKMAEEKVLIQDTPTEETPTETSGFSDQVQNAVLGGEKKDIEEYRKQVHPDDTRNNILEVDFGLGLFYNDSKSDFSYRRYSSMSQLLDLGGKIWLTPFFGLTGEYMTTMGGEVRGQAMDFRVPMTHDWTSFGINFRRIYGLSRRAPSMEVGLRTVEHKASVPVDSKDRARIKSSGVELNMKSRFAETPRYSWTFALRFAPRMSHTEGGTALKIRSGAQQETNLLGVAIGGESKFTRENQVFWSLDYVLEKNQFRGKASPVDPISDVRPENVNVTNSFVFFTFGYRLGN